MLELLIASGVSGAIGVGLLFARRTKQNKLLGIKSTQTSTARELNDLCNSVREELGNSGGFTQLAEVKGLIKCRSPLTSELAKQPCVYYAMSVDERYEETVTERDAQGREVRRTRTTTSNVAGNSQRVEFEIDDGTGIIAVNPNGADIDGFQVLSKYEPAQAGGRFSYGSFSWSASASGRKILGYEMKETILPLDRRTYVIGEATDRAGALTIQKPVEKGKPFIITLKSEEELTRSTESTIKGLAIGAVVCFVIACGCLAYGLLKP